MSVSSPSDLIEALIQDELDRLLGTPESGWLDFKEKPYDLGDERQKWELAKDVAGFANAGTGFIVIGVRTRKHQSELVETADEIVRIPKSTIDADACRKIVRSAIYPNVQDVNYTLYPRSREVSEGLFVIEIIPENQHDRPFILRRAFDESGPVKGAIAIPYRDGDQTEWWSAERLHEHIATGGRLNEGRTANSERSGEAFASRVSDIVDEAQLEQDWEDIPLCSLAASPDQTVDLIPDFYGEHGLARLLASPPSLRPSGFNLTTRGYAETVGSGLVARASNMFLRLEADGLMTAVVPGDRDFLQWGINEGISPPRNRMNTLALVEFTYEFFRFLHTVVRQRARTQTWSCALEGRRFKSAAVVLDEGVTSARQFPGLSRKLATADLWQRQWRSTDSPEQDATEALTYFYALFERGPEDFRPFTEDGVVSQERILAAADSLR